jgi:cell wall-associated NlpC family hydrolase
MQKRSFFAAGRTAGLVILLSACCASSVAQTLQNQGEQAAPPAVRTGNVATLAIEGAKDLADYALEFIGVKYRFGGATPQQGFDCSGLIQYVFQQVTGVSLPRTSRELSRVGEKVELQALAPGDLVFFNTRRFAFSHVGIYLGADKFIHAPRRGQHVQIAKIENSYWQKRFNGARRLIGVVPGLSPQFVSDIQAMTVDAAATPADSDGSTEPPAP